MTARRPQSERLAVLEQKVSHMEAELGRMSAKVDEMHAVLMQARGVRWAIIAVAGLEQDGVHLVDLGRHALKLGLHVRDLLLEDGEALALRTARGHGRLQIVRAIFSSERPPT